MQRSTKCHYCDKPATGRCHNLSSHCSLAFCSSHGNFLCQDCLKTPEEDEEVDRARARARFFKEKPPNSMRQLHLPHT